MQDLKMNDPPPPYPGIPVGGPQPQAGWAPQPQPYMPQAPVVPTTQANTIIVQGTADRTVIVPQNGCSRCGGVVDEDFTVAGVIIAILFFPIGVLCCLMMRERRCRSCGTMYE